MKDKCTCTRSLAIAALAIGAGMLIVTSAHAQTGRGQDVDVLSNKGNTAALQQAMQARQNTGTQAIVDGKAIGRSDTRSRPAVNKGNARGVRGGNGDGIAGANPACPNPAHDCCTTGGPGCADEVCCNLVCDLDGFCCANSWDQTCVNIATNNCGNADGTYCGGTPGSNCCAPHPGTGCDDPKCTQNVCAQDAFCCNTQWDQLCADRALQICTVCGGTPPAPLTNDNCVDRIEVFQDTQYTYSNLGATTDGIPHAGCSFFGDSDVGSDIWYNFTALATDLHSISLCGSGYDTKVAVYAGCGVCPPTDAQLVACNDDSCGLQSEASWNAVQGECYKIRIGGYAGSQGDGTFLIIQGEPPSACDTADHPCDVTGGPGCTDPVCCCIVCNSDPFCCDVAWDGLCVDNANANCSAKPPVPCDTNCPPGGIDEGEPCGEDTNGGCNSLGSCEGPSGNCCFANGAPGCEDPTCSAAICAADPFCCDVAWDGICASAACSNDACQCDPAGGDPFGAIACGETICGTAWADGNFRDTDWYRFTLPGGGDASVAKLSVNANFPVAVFVLNDACPPAILAAGSGECPTVALAALEPGNYVAFVAPAAFNGYPCKGTDCYGNPIDNKYTLTLTCVQCGGSSCQGDTDGNGVVNVDDLLNVINGWGKCAP